MAGGARLLLQPGVPGGFAGHAGPQGLRGQGVRSPVRREAAKPHLGYPPAAQALARREALAAKTGQSPRAVARKVDGMPTVQHARLLVIPVEFNPHANDDFSGFARYDAEWRQRSSC